MEDKYNPNFNYALATKRNGEGYFPAFFLFLKGGEKMTKREKWLSTTQVAEVLSVSRNAINNYIKQGKLQAIRVGSRYKVPESAIVQFLQKCND